MMPPVRNPRRLHFPRIASVIIWFVSLSCRTTIASAGEDPDLIATSSRDVLRGTPAYQPPPKPSAFDAAAQSKFVTQTSWTEIGANDQPGRNLVAVLSPDTTTLYVGSAGGGLWAGPSDGSNWRPIADDIGNGVTHMLLTPGPPQTLLVAQLRFNRAT